MGNKALERAIAEINRLADAREAVEAVFAAQRGTQRLLALIARNRRPITRDGMAGGAQVFANMLSPEKAKYLMARNLLAARQCKPGKHKRLFLDKAANARRAAILRSAA